MQIKGRQEKMWDERFVRAVETIAPGTPLRDGLENILRAKMGALVVVGDSPAVMELVDGGFSLNCDYSPAGFYEAAKMDGALVLSSDAAKILFANAQLVPESMISTCETGTRHRTAERVAKQTGMLTIAISQRRNLITMYLGNLRYTLKDVTVILSRANQALQTLEKYRSILNKGLKVLTALEFENLVTLADVVALIIRAEQVNRIAGEVKRDIIELGDEGRLVSMQMEELVPDKDVVRLLVQDYAQVREAEHIQQICHQIQDVDEEHLEMYHLARVLGFGPVSGDVDVPVVARGFRVLGQLSRIPEIVTEKLVGNFGTLARIHAASVEELDKVEGIGEVRAKIIRDGLRRVREQALLDRQL